jgi:hypothetical protein
MINDCMRLQCRETIDLSNIAEHPAYGGFPLVSGKELSFGLEEIIPTDGPLSMLIAKVGGRALTEIVWALAA